MRRNARAQHVGRNLEIDRARLAHVARRARYALVEFANDLVGDTKRARLARHRAQDLDVRNVLQRAHVGLLP